MTTIERAAPAVQTAASRPASASTQTPTVAVVSTAPETVLADVERAMRLAGAEQALSPEYATLLKINISWQHWYPGCSTTPWQLEGAICALQNLGHQGLIAAHNGTVVVDSFEGEANNKHKPVQDKYELPTVHLDTPPEPWVRYEPKAEMLVLNDIYPEGIEIPQLFAGKNIVHLPTMKTHVFTTMTGAMKNAFGGLLHRKRHWTHSVIHETLVDLLAIQQEIHPGIFAVTDGTFAGDGPGPRAMRWHIKNRIAAGADQVAVDAVVARMMGFDPLSIPFIRIAHERGLGVGDIRSIEIVGDEPEFGKVNWRFSSNENTFASRGQKLIYWGPLKPLENALLRSSLAGWAYAASNLYHNGYWLNTIGRRRIEAALATEWGRLWQSY